MRDSRDVEETISSDRTGPDQNQLSDFLRSLSVTFGERRVNTNQ